MAARGAGHIVFMSSLSGKVASGGGSVYSATKFGLRGFAHGLREDLRGERRRRVRRAARRSSATPGCSTTRTSSCRAGSATKTPDDVAAAVVKAIERDRVEVDVAPLASALGALFGGVAPGLSATVQRQLGAAEIAEQYERGQRDKRA